jgi:two-component system, HptB-dependent secretion and biofilm response regulator
LNAATSTQGHSIMQALLEVQKPSILIVDDTPENIDVLKEALKDHYVVRPAINGATALKVARANPQPDLILLDIMMPGMDGYEVMRQLQAEPATRHIPVIFITARVDMDSEIRGFETGAVDYITKPFNPLVVRRRVATHLALYQASRLLEIRNEAMRSERALLENIIIRMRAHKRFDDRYLRYLIAPADRSNGDILLSTFLPDGRQWVLVGDFTGHGLPAAVAAPLVAQVFYRAAAAGEPIEATLTAINEVLYQQLPTGFFMAGSVAEIAAHRDSVRIWSTGMPESLLHTAAGALLKIIPPTHFPPLGIAPEIDACGGEEQLAVAPGARLYLFTDGVTEVAQSTGELFDLAGVERFIAELAPSGSLDGLLARLESFHGSGVFDDDITFVEIAF